METKNQILSTSSLRAKGLTFSRKQKSELSFLEDFNIKVAPPTVVEGILNVVRLKELSEYNGHYFHYFLLCFENNDMHLILCNNEESFSEPVSRPSVINQRKEINEYLGSLDVHLPWLTEYKEDLNFRDKILIEIVTLANMQKLQTSNREDVIREYFENAQIEYQDIAHKVMHQGYEPAVYWVSESSYSPPEHFGWLYGQEVMYLKSIIETKGGLVSVLDDATGFGHVIFTSEYLLSAEELQRVEFLGTDYKRKDMDIASRTADKKIDLNVNWAVEDVNTPDHFKNLYKLNGNKKFDLILVNHLIEHLNEKPLTYYLGEWLKITEHLIISVPFETSLEQSVSSHHHLFDEEILTALGAELIETEFPDFELNTSLIKGGILIFGKK